MKKVLYFMLLLITVACNSYDEEVETGKNSHEVTTNLGVINSSEAAEIATDFMSDFYAPTRSFNNMDITSIYAWRKSEIYNSNTMTRGAMQEENNDTLLYIVNFGEENGYALVSANDALPFVVAYIEKGNLRPNDVIDNPGFKLFLNNLKDGIVWPGFPPGQTLWANVAPLLHTKWGQRAPYNKYCFTSDGQQAKAGCVAIATAQIAAFHRHPSSYNEHTYNWNAILQNDTVSVTDTIASNSVAHLVHDIGVLVNMNYGTTGSGTQSSYVQYCWEAFGYNYTWSDDYYCPDIINSLLDSIPVYMQGKGIIDGEWAGHAWVIDGSHIATIYSGSLLSPGQTYFLAHCNWGWNGNNDGYFAIGEFNLKFNTFSSYEDGHPAFNYENSTYTNVHPLTP